MSVVVTGASGHVGGNLVRALLRRGRRVRVLVHEHDAALAGLDVERVQGDVREPATLKPALDGAEVLYHLAAVISIDGDRRGVVRATNVEGVGNVVRAAREAGVRRMVHFSSIHAFTQEPLDEPLDETRAKVHSPRYPAYDRSKAAGEARVREAIAQGLDAVIVNPSGVIGPCDHEPSRMGRVFLDLYHRRLPALLTGGFTWVDVRDVVAGALAAEERGRTGENYLLAGHWQSVRQLAAIAEELTGVPAPRLACPMWLARAVAPFAAAAARLRAVDPRFTSESLHALRGNRHVLHDKAARELGFDPRPTSESVRAIYEWFAAAGRVPLLWERTAPAAVVSALPRC